MHERSYVERLRNYNDVRRRIFSDNSSKPSKHILRLKNYYAEVKRNRSLQLSSIFNCENDLRSYAEVSFLEFTELGLLDTGANISCIGADLALLDFSSYPQYKSVQSRAKTADGETQKIIGLLNIEMRYKDESRGIKLYIIPSINKRLI